MSDAMIPFARALSDASAGRPARLRFRRQDGSAHEVDAAVFVEPFKYTAVEWILFDQLQALVPSGGRVLDAGCGAGRHARWLLAKGFHVDAIDLSPAVVEIARSLGTDARVASIWDVEGRWDAVLLLGNTIGLAGSASRLPELLTRLLRLSPLVILDSVDYGPAASETRVRIEYGELAGEWFDWLHVARSDLLAAAKHVGFSCELFDGRDGSYGAVLAAPGR